MSQTLKTLRVQMAENVAADWHTVEVPVAEVVGQLAITKEDAYKRWCVVHILSTRNVISIPYRVTRQLADIVRLAEALREIDCDAYFLSTIRPRSVNDRVLEIVNAWGLDMGYRIRYPKAYPCTIRQAMTEDIPAIKRIADSYRKEIGFVLKPALEDAVTRGSLLVADDGMAIVGFCNYRSCRDGWHTIYEIAVHEGLKDREIGRRLLDEVPRPIRLKCPVDNPANAFYQRQGFTLADVVQGKKRQLNVWECPALQGDSGREK